MDLGELVAQRRNELRLSQDELGRRASVSQGYIAKIESGETRDPGARRLVRVAKALGWLSVDSLLRGDQPGAVDGAPAPGQALEQAAVPLVALENYIDRAVSRAVGKVVERRPVYAWGACGDPREGSAEPIGREAIPLGKELLVGPHGFGVRVEGESMAARGIHEGDTVWVNPERPWKLGNVVLARADGGRMYVKQVWQDPQGRVVLRSQRDGGNAIVPVERAEIIGVVVLVCPAPITLL